MKIRTGFVSNSSTSSFICSVCGVIEAGRDMGLCDFDMFECENGHIVHQACCKISEEEQEELKDAMYENGGDEVSIKFCPCCQLKKISERDELQYFRFLYGKSTEELLEEIKNKFGTFDEFAKVVYKKE